MKFRKVSAEKEDGSRGYPCAFCGGRFEPENLNEEPKSKLDICDLCVERVVKYKHLPYLEVVKCLTRDGINAGDNVRAFIVWWKKNKHLKVRQ
jgi:hypothetical protein